MAGTDDEVQAVAIDGDGANLRGIGLKEMTPSSKVRRLSSSGMREASMRCTVTSMCGYSRRNASMAGSRYMQVYSFAASCRWPAPGSSVRRERSRPRGAGPADVSA